MNSSRYFTLFCAVVMVVLTQKSDAGVVSVFQSGLEAIEDALDIGNKYERDTIKYIINTVEEYQATSVYFNAAIIDLREPYINGTKQLAKSEAIILDAIKSVKKLILENPEAAKKLLQKAFEAARNELFKSGIPMLKLIGKTLGLSNDGARQGLNAASQLIQREGIASLDTLNTAEDLYNRGIAAKDNAAEVLLKTLHLAIESGFAGSFNLIQESIEKACEALRDAQSRPTLGQVENVNCEVTIPKVPEASNATKAINEAVENALKRGANPNLVQTFKQVLLCALSETLNITAGGQQTVENLKTIAKAEPLAAKMTFFKQSETVKKRIHNVIAQIVLVLGDVALKSGSLSDREVETAIIALEEGSIEIFLGIKIAGELIVDGLRYGGDAPAIAFEAATMIGKYGENAFIEGLVKVVRLILEVL